MEPISRQAKSQVQFARNAFDDLTNAMHPASPARRRLSDGFAHMGLGQHGRVVVVEPMQLQWLAGKTAIGTSVGKGRPTLGKRADG